MTVRTFYRYYKIRTLIWVILLIFLKVSSPISAQQSDFHLTLNPPVSQIRMKPGTTVAQTLTIHNKGQQTLTLSIKPRDFVSDGNSGTPVLQDKFSFPYLTLQNSNLDINTPFTLQPGQEQQLLLEFSIPDTLRPQEFYFVVLVQGQASQPFTVNSSSSQLSGQIGSTFILSVTDKEQNSGKLEVANFDQPTIIDSLMAISPSIFIKNTGTQTTTATGTLSITNMFGKEISKMEVFPTNILPQSKRQLFGTATNDQGNLQAMPLRVQSSFLLGKYTLLLHYQSPDQEVQIYEHTVYAFPFILVAIFVISMILFLAYTKTTLFSFDKDKRKT